MSYAPFDDFQQPVPFEDEAAFLVGSLLDQHQDKVDGVLKKLRIKPESKAGVQALKRLDALLLGVAAASGATKGLAVAGRASFKMPRTLMNRLSSVGLLSATVLYVLAHARVRGISPADARVQSAMRTALTASMSLPVGNAVVENLSRLARPSVGMPRDPRTVAVFAASGAAGGVAGSAFAKAIIETVDAVFGAVDEEDFADEDADVVELIEEATD